MQFVMIIGGVCVDGLDTGGLFNDITASADFCPENTKYQTI
jgi:hypothetical protein